MGKRYYCDFCDASFPDGKESRRKHNIGQVHIKMKEMHYKKYGDANTILSIELAKGPCKRILLGLPCRFGNDCHYSHLQHHEIDQLKYAAAIEELETPKYPTQLKKSEFSLKSFVYQVEKLTKIREAEIFVQKMLAMPLDPSNK